MRSKKPRWTYVSADSLCTARAKLTNGIAFVSVAGSPITLVKVKQLAKWFANAAAWLEEKEKSK